MTERQIRDGIAALGQPLHDAEIERFVRLLALLEHWNRKTNLTAISDPAKMVAGHLLDSLAVRPFVRGPRILDIGTGAGFPGLPLAVVFPDWQFTLLDSNGKKVAFVRHACGELQLDNVTAVKARAEDYDPGTGFDTVVARALATLPRLIELSARLVGEDGQLLALKGKYPAGELEATTALSDWEYEVHELVVPGLDAHARHAVSIRRA